MGSEKVALALQVLQRIGTHVPVASMDALMLRFWVTAKEALLPLEEIARIILFRESNSRSELRPTVSFMRASRNNGSQ